MNDSQKSLKIGILLRNRHDGPGGLEKVLKIVAHELKAREIDLYFYGLYPLNYTDFTQDFETVTYLDSPSSFSFLRKILPNKVVRVFHKGYVKYYGHRLFNEMAKDQLDVLITMDLSSQFLKHYADLKRFKDTTQTPLLSWVHGALIGDNAQVISSVKDKIDLFDGHLAISRGIKQELIDLYNVSNIQVVYNPIHQADIIPRDRRKFVYIGRIDKNKRVDSLLEQLKKLDGQWTLDVYGSSGNAKKDQLFQESIERLGLSDKVIFHGWTNGVWKHIQSMGVLLLNSKNEGFGLVLAEAMMRGIPVVSSDCSGPAELIQSQINGWLYPADDESELWRILQEILNEEIILPDPKQIQESVKRFETAHYIDNFLEQLKVLISK